MSACEYTHINERLNFLEFFSVVRVHMRQFSRGKASKFPQLLEKKWVGECVIRLRNVKILHLAHELLAW